MIFKRDPHSTEILTATGSEYYDNNVPFEGVYPNYVKSIFQVSVLYLNLFARWHFRYCNMNMASKIIIDL